MKKRIVIEFWVPDEVLEAIPDDFEVVYPREEITGKFSFDEIKAMLPETDAVLIMGLPFDRDVIDMGGDRLKVIGRLGVGCDTVDCAYAGEKGIAVVNTPISVTQPTAELSIAILMDVARCVSMLDRQTRKLGGCVQPHSYQPGSCGIYGKTLGIIGFGRIGKAVAHKAKGLGMNIIYSDPIPAPAELEQQLDARRVAVEELLRSADFVSLHCPYIPENHHLINEDTLSQMKPTAYLINASRGKMADEAALVRALKNGVIAGAGLDVYEFEPEITPALLELDNVVLTPHVGTWSRDVRIEMAKESLSGICAVLNGETPPNLFNLEYLRNR